MLWQGNRIERYQRFWVYRHIALVWLAEIIEFMFTTSFRPVHDSSSRTSNAPESPPLQLVIHEKVFSK